MIAYLVTIKNLKKISNKENKEASKKEKETECRRYIHNEILKLTDSTSKAILINDGEESLDIIFDVDEDEEDDIAEKDAASNDGDFRPIQFAYCSKDDEDCLNKIKKFVEKIDSKKKYECKLVTREIPLYKFAEYARIDSRRTYNECLEFFNIPRSIFLNDHCLDDLDDYTEAKCKEEMHSSFVSRGMDEEIARIFTPSSVVIKKKIMPCVYVLEFNKDTDHHIPAMEFIKALNKNGRTSNKRFLTVYSDEAIERMEVDKDTTLFKDHTRIAQGGCLAISIRNLSINTSNGVFATSGEIDNILAIIKEYWNSTQFIIIANKLTTEEKNRIGQALSSIPIIFIKEDSIPYDIAKEILQSKAKKDGLEEIDFISKIEEGKTYLSSELDEIYNKTLYEYTITTVYPHYKDIGTLFEAKEEQEVAGKAYNSLNEMIGLTRVKKLIQDAINFYRIQEKRRCAGLPLVKASRHMVFTGDPGTAKTTVARLFAQIMKDNNLLSSGKFIEVGRNDLVARFVGWTAKEVKAKFEQAKGGVLFIDEAYSLVDGSNSFGDEAINTIVQEMENRRDDVIVIFAGYKKEMKKFLDSNPGLSSRIAFHIDFDNYTEDELVDIIKLLAKKDDYVLSDEALKACKAIFKANLTSSSFGNGRFARNLLERAEMNQATRLSTKENVTKDDLINLTIDDIPTDFKVTAEDVIHHFGFSA